MTHQEQQDLLEHAIHGIRHNENKEHALHCLLRAAESGMPETMELYAEYLLTEQNNIPAAVDWYEKCFRTGHKLHLGYTYRHSSPEFRNAIDTRFTPAERKALHILPQSYYNTLLRLFFLLFCSGIGFKAGSLLAWAYAEPAGAALGAALAACLWKHITLSAFCDTKPQQ